MGFLNQEPATFVNVKLTDSGRRSLSLGQLTFFSAILSDREVDYGIDRSYTYNILNNRILSPVDVQPIFSSFDGSAAQLLSGQNVTSAKMFTTANTVTAGFFTGNTSGNTFAIDNTKYKGRNTLRYSANTSYFGTNKISGDTGSYTPIIGDLVYIQWQPIQDSGTTYVANDVILSGNPTNNLWYSITGITGNLYSLDRPIPNFGETLITPSTQKINIYFYPYGGSGIDSIATYYGSAATQSVGMFNMSIVRTNSVAGTNPTTMSGFTTYGGISYAGCKQFLGFSSETNVFGVIHFSNLFTGNTYAEQWIEGTFQFTIPNIMWHNNGAANGQGITYGIKLYDVNGSTYFDSASNSTYRNLSDSVSSTGNIVGRVYHKLQIVAITDPELLTALTYKSNRSYTLPQLNLNLVSNPKAPLNHTQATGIAQSATTYFVTYITSANTVSSSGVTYGYPQALHCSYISQIQGNVDANGNPQFISASFPLNSFPYLRNSIDMQNTSTLKGTGWNANKVQLLINSQPTSAGYNVDTVPANSWTGVSTTVGNGIYSGDTTDLTIDALKLSNYNFIISSQDVASGVTYSLNTAHTMCTGSLQFGDESFFFGSVDTGILATTYKSVITVFAANDQFDTSVNTSFDTILDDDTYITEIGILDNNGNLVATGKPTYPIIKNSGRYLAFQLEIDF